MTICTRFAPSPTGYLHIGGIRTALFSWLYARQHKGEFVLRIEDTDRERSTQASVDAILDGMKWLGLKHDLGPFYQTKRFDSYNDAIDQLLATGQAYYCYCSKERIDKLRTKQMANKEKPRYDGHCRNIDTILNTGVKPVIRFKNPQEGEVIIKDLIKGDVIVQNKELDDLIIARSDATPTYNLTVVVDDSEMGITHVIRGDDHLNNTPRQINILKALGAKVPQYAHVPMILGSDGQRLSKRHGAVNVMNYRDEGYLPQALLNYLVRLGWSHGDQEIFSLTEMIELFDLKSVNSAASTFNPDKLLWLNQQYIKTTAAEELVEHLQFHCQQLDIDTKNGPNLTEVIKLQAERAKTLKEMAENSRFFFTDTVELNEKAAKKHLKPAIYDALANLCTEFEQMNTWQADAIHVLIHKVAAKYELKLGKIAQPLRVAVTGGTISPSIDATVHLIGKNRSIVRIKQALAFMNENHNSVIIAD
ncbi:glutamate--tRNA ligase [Candidatus Marithrix sp. Canyon 246]|uniref:glutamate--tRNA ligase n=1 Tax=Candidatus Marithrix sp. Canyon 246 TaxID=1827136 RepID=UPI00084A2C0E|nr:glutamate--tRNA ligase [Candidatus Marithrix sp. Canyon 246]